MIHPSNPTVRRPYHCTACGRSWSVFAPLNRVVLPGPCLFCGLHRVQVEPPMVMLPGGLEEPLREWRWGRRTA